MSYWKITKRYKYGRSIARKGSGDLSSVPDCARALASKKSVYGFLHLSPRVLRNMRGSCFLFHIKGVSIKVNERRNCDYEKRELDSG